MDRNQLTSISYWRGQRQPQRFYVAFCLLMSTIQDAVLGLKERRSHNLNWAATCSYYSLVHAGRLLSFLALGDYPTSHAELRQLISGAGNPPRRRLPPRGYPFDWLREFSQLAGAEPNRRAPATIPTRLSELRSCMVDYLLTIGVVDASEHLGRFGNTLLAAGPLRSDSNYEALLIAMSTSTPPCHQHSGGWQST